MANPVVGELFIPPGSFRAPCIQAGGVGTPVTDPTQTVEERTGKFAPACGHSINGWDIQRAAIAGVSSALITCPLCGYIQDIVTPFTLLDGEEIVIR